MTGLELALELITKYPHHELIVECCGGGCTDQISLNEATILPDVNIGKGVGSHHFIGFGQDPMWRSIRNRKVVLYIEAIE